MKREQLGQLILASEDSMYHVAKSLLYNDADCQDAIQEAIAKAFDKIGTLKQDTYAKTWLLRILINECNKIHRHYKNFSVRKRRSYHWRLVSRKNRGWRDRIIRICMKR